MYSSCTVHVQFMYSDWYSSIHLLCNIGAHVLETHGQSSCSSRTVEEILGARPTNDDVFWGGTNPRDVFIDTTNSKK